MGYRALAVGVLIIAVGYFNTFSQKGQDQVIKVTESSFVSSNKMEMNLTAFVLGGTGAVGKAIIHALAASPQFIKVTLIGRRQVPLPTPIEDSRYDKFDEKIIDFDNLPEHADAFKGYDVGFSSLGTTRAKAGPEGFYKVDHDYVVNTAKLAKDGGCKHLHLVSSWGANKESYFLYPKTKVQVEEELSQMGFPRFSIYRPGLLLTDDRPEVRMGEAVARCAARALDYFRWFSVEVPVLGSLIVANSFRDTEAKTEILDHGTIIKMVKVLTKSK